jgi:hypothetical protein
MRIPVRRTMSTSSACHALPCSPASANPVVMMTQAADAGLGGLAHARDERAGGTARMATSAGAGASPIDGYAFRPTTSARRRLIG